MAEVMSIFNVTALVVTAYILYRTWKAIEAQENATRDLLEQNRIRATVEATIECNNRFDRIYSARKEMSGQDFATRFWSHQLDQFDYFLSGVIKKEDFYYWMLSRHTELMRDQTFTNNEGEEFSWREGWKIAKELWVPSPFTTFVDKYVFDGEDARTDPCKLKDWLPAEIASERVKNRIREGIAEKLSNSSNANE